MAIRLVAFDLDGTLIRELTCVQAIGGAIGRAEECRAFERGLVMRDVEGVTASRETMAGWYRPFSLAELTSGLADLTLAPGAAEAFGVLREHGVATAIVSITWSFAVEWFAEMLGADHAFGTRLTPTGIEHVWPADKGRWLEQLMAREGLDSSQVAAVGDSDGDRELLEAAGMRFFVGRTALDVANLTHVPNGDLAEIARRIVAVAPS
jgi:HAD superfamily phosphoserine phosphatase-like hydrolase